MTEEGLFLKQHAAQAMRTLDEAEDAVKIFSTQWQQTIEVCIESASAVVVDAIARYSREHPEVAFTVSQDEEARSSDIVIKTVSNITSTYASCHKEGSGVDETNAAVAKAKGMMDKREIH